MCIIDSIKGAYVLYITHAQTYTNSHIHTHMYIYMCVCVYALVDVCKCVCGRVSVYVYLFESRLCVNVLIEFELIDLIENKIDFE